MTTLYRSGYLVRVTSWENDGDYRNTKEIQLDTLDHVVTVVALCKLLGPGPGSDFGNMYEPDEEELQQFEQAIAALPGIKHFIHDNFSDSEADIENPESSMSYMDYILEFLYELGLTGSEHFFTRVCESIKVYHIPVDVLVQEIEMK